MPIKSSSKACRGVTGFFGDASVVGVATMSDGLMSNDPYTAFLHSLSIRQYKETKNVQYFAYFAGFPQLRATQTSKAWSYMAPRRIPIPIT
jgi:hypothetical protein